MKRGIESVRPADEGATEVVLTVVVPVFNQEATIAENVRTIRDRVAAGMTGPIEVIVVSDGSIDRTEEQALVAGGNGVRVLHYDRNLGKGYAVKLGVLEARGRWIGYCDADLDLDPALLPEFVRVAEAQNLDFAIGSKRHPASEVVYPKSRRVASWLFQHLIWLLFRFDVRDTQVGMKVFRREVADQVFPLLLVKRFAFDIELLAVARELGFDRIEEQPIRLDYRFTGSGVRSLAVGRALVDVAAIAYRLRILHYYRRRRDLVGELGRRRARDYRPLVSIVGDASQMRQLDYPVLERVAHAEDATGDIVAFLHPLGTPAGNWLSATVPFLANPEIGAVVTPLVASGDGTLAMRAAAALRESRLGGGSQFFRYTPGNLRYVADYPGGSVVVRRSSLPTGPVAADHLVETIVAAGKRVVYTPESVVVAPAEPLLRPHAAAVAAYGRSRGRALRRSGPRAFTPSGLVLLLLFPALVLGAVPALLSDGPVRRAWLAVAAVYSAGLLGAGGAAALRFRSPIVGAVAVPGLVATHAAYVVGVAQGVGER